jgi:hypothetical protein
MGGCTYGGAVIGGFHGGSARVDTLGEREVWQTV